MGALLDEGHFSPVPDPRPNDSPWQAMTWPPPARLRLTGRVVELSRCDPERDAEALFVALDHAEVWAHMPWRRPVDGGELAAALRRMVAAERVVWIVRTTRPLVGLSEGTVVGTSSYLDISAHDARLEIGATAYAPAAWGSAVNPDAKLALLTYAFESLGVGRVQLKTDVRNVRSQQAIARLGARYEGTLRRYQRRADGSVRDTALFSIVAEEWPGVRQSLLRRLDGVG